jgi:DNA-binding Xre family transcriptional regulator
MKRNGPLLMAMAEKGYNSKSLCNKAGLHEGTLSKLINYRSIPTEITLRVLSRALSVSMADLGYSEMCEVGTTNRYIPVPDVLVAPLEEVSRAADLFFEFISGRCA